MMPVLPVLLSLLLGSARDETPAPRVVIVPIQGEIGFGNLALLRRAVAEIRKSPPDLVILEIDTPGGRIDHMLAMGELIMGLAPVPTAAFIRPMDPGGITGGAWSAGAYLAMSCGKLYLYPGTVIGAAAPVAQSPEGPLPVEEKYVSAFREKFRARAEQNGYPPNLAVAMVDKDLEVFEVVIDGRKRYLTEREMDQERDAGKSFEWPRIPFVASGKLLTLTDRQVADAGMGRVASGRDVIYGDFGWKAPSESTIAASWSEALVGFLTSGMVSTVLLLVGMLGIWIELKTPGFGVPGILGAAALALIFFGHHLAGLAQVPELLLVGVGVALVALEIFVFPGIGIAAILGVVCIAAGLVLSFQDFVIPDPTGAPWQVDALQSSVGRILISFLGAGVGLMAALRFLPTVPLFRKLVHGAAIAGGAPMPKEEAGLEGRRGRAVTPLKPGGKIDVEGRILDVVAEGEFVESGDPVEILRIEGMRVVVGRRKP
jgi:membrane-bound serine protease (ClpP class)